MTQAILTAYDPPLEIPTEAMGTLIGFDSEGDIRTRLAGVDEVQITFLADSMHLSFCQESTGV